MGVDVRAPKPLDTHPGDEIVAWAREQLAIARSILDNPGGGLLFATQTIGQVKAGVRERAAQRWQEVVSLLDRAEDAGVHRDFVEARRILDEALRKLG
jgi:hypothetical protein